MKLTEEKKGSELVCQNGMANFSPTCPIDLSGPPPEVHCPEYSWWIEPKQTFPYCHKSLEVLEVSCPLILNLCMHCVFSGFDI